MESSTQRRLTGLKEKVPDIQKTLDMVVFLKGREVRLKLGRWIASCCWRLADTMTPAGRRAARDDV